MADINQQVRGMRIAFVFSVLGAAGLWAGEPRWGTIDYAQPAKYLAIAE